MLHLLPFTKNSSARKKKAWNNQVRSLLIAACTSHRMRNKIMAASGLPRDGLSVAVIAFWTKIPIDFMGKIGISQMLC